MKVWKYDLAVSDSQTVDMPLDAELLHVESQHGFADLIQLWARVEPTRSIERRQIIMRGTGHEVGDSPYIGTVVVADGASVWHVFDGGAV